MKFTLLIATAAALQIRQSGSDSDSGSGSSGDQGPSCKDMADGIFSHCDKNKDDELSWKEAKACGAPDDFKPVFHQFAGKDG